MDFKQVQWGYFLPLMVFFTVFFTSQEIAYYTTKKETDNKFFRFICFSSEPVPLVSVILIIIDYVYLSTMIAFNVISLFLSTDCAVILVLIYIAVALVFASITGGIAHYVKSHYEDNT